MVSSEAASLVSIDVGLLVLRMVLALLLTGHACQKLFGWFQGRGIRGTAVLFEADGLRPGVLLVTFAALSELTAAFLLALGFWIPLAAAIIVSAMTVAISTLWPRGLWAHLGGFEVPLMYALMALVLAITGPGRFSFGIGSAWFDASGVWWGLTSAALGLAAAMPLVLMVFKSRAARDEAHI